MGRPAPPGELLEEVLKNRAEGTRVALPAASTGIRPSGGWPALAAAVAGAITVAGLATLLLPARAGAGASELRVEPARPMPGQEIHLHYRPLSDLAGTPSLRLRLRLRMPDSGPPRGTLGEYDQVLLVPDGEGGYDGEYVLPPDFAYASIAVETLDGNDLDDRNGRLWTIRAHDENGVPLLPALRQEFLVLQDRSFSETWETLREMTVLYPDRAEGWSLKLLYERFTWLPDQSAVAMAGYSERFLQLQRQAEGRSSLGLKETEAMARYAASLADYSRSPGDFEALRRWLDRLEGMDPANRLVLTYRLGGFLAPTDSADAHLERLWSIAVSSRPTVCDFARSLGFEDMAAARRWALRCVSIFQDPGRKGEMALTLAAQPETRERGIREIQAVIADLDNRDAADRPLDRSPAEDRSDSRSLRAALQIALAEHLVEGGQPLEAMAELRSADSLGLWIPDLYRTRLEAELQAADTVGASRDLLRLELDPIYPRSSIDSLRHRLGSQWPGASPDLRQGIRGEMVERVAAGMQMNRGLPDASLLAPNGERGDLADRVAGGPTILILWDRRLNRSPQLIEQVRSAERILGDGPGQLLWVTQEPLAEPLLAFKRSHDLALPVYQDPLATLANALGEWGMDSYFVIDRGGRIRSRAHSLMEAVRQLEVLEMGLRQTA
jgi:hypothetical protein